MIRKTRQAFRSFFVKDFERLFLDFPDPWNLDKSNFQKKRFTKIEKIIKNIPHKTILEIGSAEGHLTKYLTNRSDNVTCLEISKQAIKRAKLRAPRAKYINSSFQNYNFNSQKFDLIICSEVLYYLKNKKEAVAKMEKMADFILMSNFGLWDVLFSFYFKQMSPIKKTFVFHLLELKFGIISLWSKKHV